MDIKLVIMIVFSLVSILAACAVAFSRNIVHAAFALLGVFAGVLGLYVLLSADFVAVMQFVVYIGGILVLILFAVMFTTKIGERKLSNRAMGPVAGLIGMAALGFLMWKILAKGAWQLGAPEIYEPTTAAIGDMFLNEYLLPFEIVSLLLVLVLVGAVVLARREVR